MSIPKPEDDELLKAVAEEGFDFIRQQIAVFRERGVLPNDGSVEGDLLARCEAYIKRYGCNA